MPISDLFNLLKDVPQSPKYHPEGDVFTHTVIVMHAAVASYSGKKTIGYHTIAAVFHDVGKLTTTEVKEDGRITAYGHEFVSEKFFRQYQPIVFKEMSEFEIEAIAYVIRNHMRIKLNMRPHKFEQLKLEATEIMKLPGFEKVSDDDKRIADPYQVLTYFPNWDRMVPREGELYKDSFTRLFGADLSNGDLIHAKDRLDFLVRYWQSRQNVYNLSKKDE